MKKITLKHFIAGRNVLLGLFITGSIAQPLSAQQTFTFTNCGATGQFGPNQGQVNSTYTTPNLLTGMVTITGQGIQQWTVPGGGMYKIEAWGAKGGNTQYGNGGKGAYMSGEFNLTAGTILKIVVGQMGSQTTDNQGAGGGGGSFVADNNNTPLIVAGGGGGNGSAFLATAEVDGTTNVAKQGNSGGGCAGTPGNGGTNCGTMGGSGGGGFFTDGANSPNRPSTGGKSFTNGAAGGVNEGSVGTGGFGGGAGGATNCGYGGGGGGYAGGGGGGWATQCGGNGGGAGSYNNGTNQNNQAAISVGNGTVMITRLCNVDLQASKNPICNGESVNLVTNAVSNIVWSHNGSTAAQVNVSPTENATYTVTGQAATGCTMSIVLTVTVNPLPNIAAIVSPSVMCVGKDATITASGANTYTWTTLSQNGPVAIVNPPATTGYNVSGTNQFGCVNSALINVNVNTNQLGISSNTSVCQGSSVKLSLSNAVTYTWSTGNNFATTVVSPITNTTYMASGTDIYNCVLSNMVAVTVNQKPNVIANTNKGSVCKGEAVTLTAGGATTYSWSSGLGVAASVNVTLPAETVYNYAVTGADANGCTNTANVQVTANRCTGINEASKESSNVRVYPNPAMNEVTVELNNGQLSTIEVMDLTGRTVMSVTTKDKSTKLDLDKLSNGVYYFRVKSTENVEIVRVVKNN